VRDMDVCICKYRECGLVYLCVRVPVCVVYVYISDTLLSPLYKAYFKGLNYNRSLQFIHHTSWCKIISMNSVFHNTFRSS
jgi:hypothetical protein